MGNRIYFLKLFYIALLIGLGIGFWQVQTNMKNEIQSVVQRLENDDFSTWTASVPVGSAMPPFELSELNGRVVSSNTFDSKLIMLVFFSPTDCSTCLAEAKLWREIDDEYEDPDVLIIGITTAPVDTYKMTIFKRGKNIGFPVLLDPNGQYKNDFGITNTPTKVLIDQFGTIIDASASKQSLVEHKLFKQKVIRLLGLIAQT